jgi:ferredoxin
MSYRVDANLLTELKKYGDINIEACFNCGNCTAICPLTDDEHTFPRNTIRLVQMGLKEPLLKHTDPWLCYYCGECSQTCPKKAEPAEAMMAVRRWLTAQYDRSGHGAKLYTSEKAVWSAILRYSLVPLILLILYHAYFFLRGDTRIITDTVALNTFAPVYLVWGVVLIDFLILGSRLFRNIRTMFDLVLGSNEETQKIPLSIYIQEFKTFLLHIFTQRRWRECDEEDQSRWLKHLGLISGYVVMLVLIVGLLWWFQTDKIYPIYNPQRWLGYFATLSLMVFSGEILISRLRKNEEMHRFSHPSDWLFPSFLFLGALTGILVHAFRYAGWAWPTYIIYTIHVMVMIAMLDTEVGIGKWTHLFYRPLAIYFDSVRKAALQQSAPELAPAGAD